METWYFLLGKGKPNYTRKVQTNAQKLNQSEVRIFAFTRKTLHPHHRSMRMDRRVASIYQRAIKISLKTFKN